MTGNEIRDKFLKFFEQKNHKILPSASLIPANDPSILWTAAGMIQFKPYFTGAAKPDCKRVTTCQKCLRTPDIEEVGKTARHHTFFEMLGNFSFGDYFKDEAVHWAWEFVTEHLGFAKERLWISIYLDDDEAFEIWNKKIGVPEDRIVRMGKEENFWEIGVGPCGPCSEIYLDLGEARGCGSPSCGPGCDCDRFLEIWNLVFIQFFQNEEGELSPLTNKGIDTGMGLERVASAMQNVPTNFDTDLLQEIMSYTGDILGVKYGGDPDTDKALKVIADHTRAITFAISDGALPSNEGRGYVVRRLLRRAFRFGRMMDRQEPFLNDVARAVIKQMKGAYPELVENEKRIVKVIFSEEQKFGETLAQGSEILYKLINDAKDAGQEIVAGRDAFRLYDTYGFPLELTREIAAEAGLSVDEDEFSKALEEQRERARNAHKDFDYLSERDALFGTLLVEIEKTIFTGYDVLQTSSQVMCMIAGEEKIHEAGPGQTVDIILDKTPCYAESGGQVADKAEITGPELKAFVTDVFTPVEGLIVHRCKINNGILKVKQEVNVQVDSDRRKKLARNHTATHLLHQALKNVLGEHVNQAGSLVEPEKLRFDFTHFEPVKKDELRQVEDIVNDAVLRNYAVESFETSLEDAKSRGAAALFGEKYGERVRVIKIGSFSIELCGGTHLHTTAQAGIFKLLGESSVGSGVRRLEAVTGEGGLEYIKNCEQQISDIAAKLKSKPSEIVSRVEMMTAGYQELERKLESLRARLARYEVESLLNKIHETSGVRVLAEQVEARDMDSLRAMVDLLKDKMGSGIVVLGTCPEENKVNLVAGVSKELNSRGMHAGKIVKNLASMVGGGGGGRPDMAQAGGKDPSRLSEALDKVNSIIEEQASISS
ncbi:MAG: alanine--tRNA ligase [Clostridiales bacterium]|nr:alanine--tRNA ligase [Clostridiales bacterium]MCF8021118.1 alanine--tRNA ligase [Clostridiales bacterium]